MNLFEAVKTAVTPRMAAERYGLPVRQGNMTGCPFHIVGANSISLAPPSTAELVHSIASPLPAKSYDFAGTLWTPSMKLNEDYFYCFGCGATGDAIDFVARLFNLSSYDAAKKLAYDFGIDPDKPPTAAALRKPQYLLVKAFKKETLHYTGAHKKVIKQITIMASVRRDWKKAREAFRKRMLLLLL